MNQTNSISKKINKKNRPSFVCMNCKRKKIKCDRKHPCNNCIRGRCTNSCQYANSISKYGNIINFDVSPVSQVQKPLALGSSTQFARTGDNRSLRIEISNLKSQIQSLEQLLEITEVLSEDPNSILNLKLERLKKFSLIKKSNKACILGPMSYSITSCSMFRKNLFKLFKSFIDKERNTWKSIHGPSINIPTLVNTEPDAEAISAAIQDVVTPCCNAIFERLIYFKDHLNNLLYHGFVDMEHVFYWFSKCFIKSSNNTYIFITPHEKDVYVELSLMFSLVESATLFGRYDPSVYFQNLMSDDKMKIIHKLSTDTLALSKFYRKTTYSTLISLVVITDNIYTYSVEETDSLDEAKSSYALSTTLLLAFRVGLHRDPDSIDQVTLSDEQIYQLPAENWRTLWSHLRLLDASYSSNSGCPLLVNDRCSNIKGPSFKEANTVSIFTGLQRATAELTNSNDPISLNDIINLRKKYLSFFNSLGTFKELICPNQDLHPSSYDSVAHKLKFKFDSLGILAILNNYLSIAFSRRDLFPEEQITVENNQMLKKQAEFYDIEFMKTTIISWRLMKDICQSETVFGDQNFKYLAYFKTTYMKLLFPTVVKFCVVATFSYFPKDGLVTVNKHQLTNDVLSTEVINLSTVDYDEYESSLSLEYDGNKEVDYNLKGVFNNPKQLVTFMCDLYASIAGCPLFADNYGYFCMLKLISVFSCFVDSMMKINPPLTQSEIQVDDVIEKTKAKVAEKMRVGFVDMGFTLGDNDESVNNLLNSIFNQEDPFCWFYNDHSPFDNDDAY